MKPDIYVWKARRCPIVLAVMPVALAAVWAPGHTDLSTFFLSRFNQLVDEDEVITNRHPATNGLILLEELMTIADIALVRWKNSYRLQTLLSESVDEGIPTSLPNDPILRRYFRATIQDFRTLSNQRVTQALARQVRETCLIHLAAIAPRYMTCVETDIRAFDLHTRHFDTVAADIDQYLRVLVPQLRHEGYATGYLQMPSKKLARRNLGDLADSVFGFFASRANRTHECFLRQSQVPAYLQTLNPQHVTLVPGDFWDDQQQCDGYRIQVTGRDPFSAFLAAIMDAFKRWALQHPESDPGTLDEVWANAHYFTSDRFAKFDFASNLDPVVRSVRSNTLARTLSALNYDLADISASVLGDLEEPLYFYHLARSVPSIEASFIMLWTALEALTSPGSDKSDIETVKEQFAPGLAIGAVGRRVNSLVQRIRVTGHANGWPFLGPDAQEYDEQGLAEWTVWAVDQAQRDTADDPYNVLRQDPLTCRQYRLINEGWGRLSHLADVIASSKRMTEYQLDRLYLTRNRLIHSGQFGHAGTYQWVHLEWYVGKLLAQGLIGADALSSRLGRLAREVLAASLQGQYRATADYCVRFGDQGITADHLTSSGLLRLPVMCF